jgi:hypothetical protein
MRKALTMVEALKNAGIDFVPVPVRDPAHKIALIGQTLAVLEELEEDSEQ